jgi:streptogramin lyase
MKNVQINIFIICLLLVFSTVTLATAQKWTTYTVANGLASNNVTAIAIDKNGNKWFGTQSSGVTKYDGTIWTTYNIANSNLAGKNMLGNYIVAVAIDLMGNKWFGGGFAGDYGVSKFNDATWTTYTTANGLENNAVFTIAIDKQGNKWFGTQAGGVSKFDGVTWTTYNYNNTNAGLAGDWVNAIAIDNQGNKWFGARNYDNQSMVLGGGVSKFNDTNWTTYDTTNGLVGNFVSSIAIDSQGNKWIGTVTVLSKSNKVYGGGVSKFDGAVWTTYKTKDGLASNNVYSIAIDKHGNKWFGTDSGVSKYDGTTWTTYTTSNGLEYNRLAGNLVQAIAIDDQGNKWFGTSDGGVSMYNDTAKPVQPPPSVYFEGIDTTDANGYGLDSSFQLSADNTIKGQDIACYYYNCYETSGTFNYSFDEISLAADSISFYSGGGQAYHYFKYPGFTYCFVIKKSRDSTFWKVQITGKLADNRYVYKYGSNTMRSNRIMIKPNYDRSVKYKPNNLHYCHGCCTGGCCAYFCNSFNWEPPLTNNNHLEGYILYRQKPNIDTSQMINLAQWDSIGYTDSTKYSFPFSSRGEYFNVVAVYTEGKSDFLKGWTRLSMPSSVTKYSSSQSLCNNLEIKKVSSGFSIGLPERTGILSLSIYTIAGRQVSMFSGITTNRIFWNTSQQNLAEGLYIVKAELPDRNCINQTLVFTR